MSDRQSVILAMLTAGAVFVAAYGLEYAADQQGKRLANPLGDNRLGGVEIAVAWAVMATFLIILADIPATGALSAAFAWLIFLAILFVYGSSAAQNLIGLMGGATPGNSSSSPNAPRGRGPTPI